MENPSVNQSLASGLLSRELIQRHCVVATLFVLGNVVMDYRNHDWNADVTVSDYLLTYLLAGGSMAGGVVLLYFMWLRPTGKTDRIAMLITLALPAVLPLALVLGMITPEAWEYWVGWVAVLVGARFHGKVFQELEAKWSREGKIIPMADGQAWPRIDKEWYGFIVGIVIFSSINQSLGVTGYEGEDTYGALFWGIAMPVLLTKVAFWAYRKQEKN